MKFSIDESSEIVSIEYDQFVRKCQNSWHVIIDKQNHYFPFSVCDIDKGGNTMLCPKWLAIDKELEGYIS